MQRKAILFDLDGTLLDTLEDLGDSMNAVLSARGLPTHPLESYRYFVGDGVGELVRRALPADRAADETLVHACTEGMRLEYDKRWHDKTRLYDGVGSLLDALTRAGVKLTVLSNKPDAFVRLIVQHYFAAWRFAAALGARPSVPRKPDPAAAIEISRLLRLAPSEFLYVGDTNTDMQTARAAGMFAVGALWGFRTQQELEESGAAAVAAHPMDVVSLL
ncbi:MAG TPA: HAD-IA family hydrolase [Spirochaetia bacterium]|nr:HAD-IA family hydrolase [Spirochaetia bacterium]